MIDSLRKLELAFLVLACISMVNPPAAKARDQIIWQIGTFDEASVELGRQIDYGDPAKDPVYVVGKSEPAKDWPAYQPGSANGRAGFRPHPFTIEFDLPDTPKGIYVLKIATLSYTPRIPRLEVEINGRRAWFYQTPRLNYRMGDPAGNGVTYATDTISFEIPTKFLRLGVNKLILTALDEPGKRDDAIPPPGTLGDSGITYDALELRCDASRAYRSGEISVKAAPTIFYNSIGGKLFEEVDVYVDRGDYPQKGHITLALGSLKFGQELTADRDFGEEKIEFEVPEFGAGTQGEVTVSINRRSKLFPLELSPAKKWNVFVVPLEHLDIGYSDYQAKTYEVQSRALDQAIETIRTHPSFRYSLDGYWVADQFLKTRSESQRERFFQLVRENKIKVPASYFNLLTGFASSEEMIRSLYASYRFNEEEGGHFDYANITDVPSYSWSYASVLAAAGLKCLVAASNNERAPILRLGHLNSRSPFWWEGPDGARIPMWYSVSYQQMPRIFGLPPQVAAGRDSLPIFLQQYNSPDYKSDGVIVYGTQWENTALYTSQAMLDEEWNSIYAYPRVSFTGFPEAMEYITRQAGDNMPVVRGDGGPYWEDGIGSDAYYAAIGRENQHRALSAEKASTISSYVNPNLRSDRKTLNSMWEHLLLFDEHCWEADRSVQDPESQLSIQQRAVKDSRATEGKLLVNEVLERSLSALSDSIDDPSGTVIVFNSLNWPRSSLVEMDLTRRHELVDLTTKQVVPYELLFSGKNFSHIRFWASDVPSIGYKSYAIRPEHSKNLQPATIADTVLENAYYRLVLDAKTGAVQSIFDKDLNRELVDPSSPYRFDQYVYVTGAGQKPNRLTRYSEVLPIPQLEPEGASGGRIISVAKTPFGMVAHLVSSGVNTPLIETEITLLDGQKAILFTNRVQKKKVYTKEGVYFAFPFDLDHPQFTYETQNGYVNPAKDLLPGAGREWFSVQHWVALRQGDTTAVLIPIDAPLVAMGDIVRGTFPTEFGERKGALFSYIMNNYWGTNYVAGQGGDFVFRYVLRSGKNLEPSVLSRMGWEAMSPLEINEIIPQDKVDDARRPLASAQSSFLQVYQPNVVLTAWKEAEDENGTILRFTELSGKSTAVKVAIPIVELGSAWACNAVEKCEQPLPLSSHSVDFNIKPFQIVTIRIQGKSAVQ